MYGESKDEARAGVVFYPLTFIQENKNDNRLQRKATATVREIRADLDAL